MTSLPVVSGPSAGMPDSFGRVATDLRVSVTDRCNLRCSYCMPAQGLLWMPKPEMLTDEELLRIIDVFIGLGVRQVRLTGGEPLLRRSIVDLVAGIAALRPRPQIAMTTNGVGLDRMAAPLAGAGLDRVNVSLDTVDPQEFFKLTRRDRLTDVEKGLKAAASVGLTPVKVNAVAMRGINDHSAADVLQWCCDRGYSLRFIEQMPLD
ncbi:MAG TPA: radical SAM protein, partial [Dermatophilaceae bacterium]